MVGYPARAARSGVRNLPLGNARGESGIAPPANHFMLTPASDAIEKYRDQLIAARLIQQDQDFEKLKDDRLVKFCPTLFQQQPVEKRREDLRADPWMTIAAIIHYLDVQAGGTEWE